MLITKLKESCTYSLNDCTLVLKTHDMRGHQNISCSSAMLDCTWHLWKCLSVPQVLDWGRHISSITHSLHNTSGIPIRPPLIVFKDNITLSFLDPLLSLIWDKQAVTACEEWGASMGCLRPNISSRCAYSCKCNVGVESMFFSFYHVKQLHTEQLFVFLK